MFLFPLCVRLLFSWFFDICGNLSSHSLTEEIRLYSSLTLYRLWDSVKYFMPLISFDTPWKHQKTKGFLIFSEGIKRDQWHEMGELILNQKVFLFTALIVFLGNYFLYCILDNSVLLYFNIILFPIVYFLTSHRIAKVLWIK